ncbi:hypothetical protein NS220_16030 [Microbacterium testaceum]|uniref:Bacterial Ig-like domain-containing protein n=1 Tax=Microbacterium testaceum TaxID=2033 RepID=A0A147ETH4_MICTE|nr:hypothetical protein [Microbacterium testaceum]KTR89179.1 hypothetical protein NS220_16030 [Microbacterium testaceum]
MSNRPASPRSLLRRSAAVLATAAVAASVALGGAVPAQAASATLTANPTTVTAGGATLLTAQGFTPSDTLSFDLDGAPLATSPLVGSTETANANGDYDGDAWMPDSLSVGTHTISVTDASGSAVASTTITVVPRPTASVTPASQALSGYLATGVTATFSGFTPGDTVSFGISDATSGTQLSTTAVADANGQATLSYVPTSGSAYAQVGTYHLIAATGDLSIVSEEVSFEVTADPAPNSGTTPIAAPANTPVAPAATPVKRAATFTG